MNARLRKLKYRAWHRGFREADLILGPFADQRLERLGSEELDQFEELLEQPDQDLYTWITGQTPAPAAFADGVLASIIDFRLQAHAALQDHGA